jgi:hypothetical protein
MEFKCGVSRRRFMQPGLSSNDECEWKWCWQDGPLIEGFEGKSDDQFPEMFISISDSCSTFLPPKPPLLAGVHACICDTQVELAHKATFVAVEAWQCATKRYSSSRNHVTTCHRPGLSVNFSSIVWCLVLFVFEHLLRSLGKLCNTMIPGMPMNARLIVQYINRFP